MGSNAGRSYSAGISLYNVHLGNIDGPHQLNWCIRTLALLAASVSPFPFVHVGPYPVLIPYHGSLERRPESYVCLLCVRCERWCVCVCSLRPDNQASGTEQHPQPPTTYDMSSDHPIVFSNQQEKQFSSTMKNWFVLLASCTIVFSETNDRDYSQLLGVPIAVSSNCWAMKWRPTCTRF